MKKTTFLIIVINCLLLNVLAQNDSKSKELEEAEKLNRQSGQLYEIGQYDQALKIAFRELILRSKLRDEQYKVSGLIVYEIDK